MRRLIAMEVAERKRAPKLTEHLIRPECPLCGVPRPKQGQTYQPCPICYEQLVERIPPAQLNVRLVLTPSHVRLPQLPRNGTHCYGSSGGR